MLLILTSVSYFMKGCYQGANMNHFFKKIDLHLEPSKTGVANNLSQLLQCYNLWNKVIVNVISYLCVSPAVKRFMKLIPLQMKRPLILPRLSRLQLAAFINKIKWIGIFFFY